MAGGADVGLGMIYALLHFAAHILYGFIAAGSLVHAGTSIADLPFSAGISICGFGRIMHYLE